MAYRYRDPYSKNGSGKSAQDKVGKEIYQNLEKLLNNRRKLLCGLPVKHLVNDLYSQAYDPQEWEAYKRLRDNPQFWNNVNKQCWFVVHDSYHSIEVTFTISETDYASRQAHGVPSVAVNVDGLHDELRVAFCHWRTKVCAFEDERDYILKKVKSLLLMCTTPGQIKRTWPELLSFMNEEGRNRVLRSRARSPLPEEVCQETEVSKDLRDCAWSNEVVRDRSRRVPEWRPEALEWMNIIFAEALVLPPYEGNEDYYPTISR